MAAVLSPSHYGPAHGILINRSPSVSPYHHPSSLPPLVPSNSFLPSSSTSSASDLATDSDYYSSSSAATSSRPGRLPHDVHESKPRSGSAPNSRRIRFAPLPDPRRNIFLADDEHPDIPSVFLDSDEQPPSQNTDASSSGKPAALSLKDQDAKHKPTPAGSLLFSPDDGSMSGSTPTLGSTATVTPNSTAFPSSAPSQLGGEWVIPRSPQPIGFDLPDDIPRRSDSMKARWSKKLFRPLLGPLASPKGYSTDDLRNLRSVGGSTTSFASLSTMMPLSRQSTAGSTADSCYSSISSPKPLEKKTKKKHDKGGESGREVGTPLYRWSSEGEASNKKGRAQSIDKRPRNSTRPRSRSANGTRLLNGRVYGARRNENPFATARSEEPEFVEWGYGGMGSVQSSGVGDKKWARVQSGGVSIGAHEQPSGSSRPRSADDDDDDGSGMAWVKKRRQRKEQQEQKNTDSSDKQTGVATEESSLAAKPNASGSDSAPPDGTEEVAENGTLSASPSQMDAPLPEVAGTPSKEEYIQAVTLPPIHHHHHRGHSHSTLERLSSVGKVDNERRDSADTLRAMRSPSAQEVEMTSVDVVAVSEDARHRTESVNSRLSTGSSSSSGSGSGDADAEADEEDLESPRDGEEEDDEDMEEQSRLTALALGAGVEKISRHKETAPEAGSD
ncbi:hypothetical protein FOMPIDRAFT_1017642 [Fomitopsis schrenkii]|uniref:Uncharacterized protein n=1 Tax=Fomitopsis schrenkii TaxID=2126942 RepID=S8E028_FOMSC|nr:hypothetical protein FOMPIDRAFT_1017642 [Fomitopsis schrenkii]